MLSREEITRLAKEAATKTVDYDLTGKPITDADVVMLGAYGPFMERFAALVAAQYEQDAKRYQWLRDMHDSGDPDWFVYAANPEIPLDAAIDQAMEQTK